MINYSIYFRIFSHLPVLIFLSRIKSFSLSLITFYNFLYFISCIYSLSVDGALSPKTFTVKISLSICGNSNFFKLLNFKLRWSAATFRISSTKKNTFCTSNRIMRNTNKFKIVALLNVCSDALFVISAICF